MTVYLDCNATTPIEPRVRDAVLRYMDIEFGNAGSRTHEYGLRAKQAVQRAREQVAAVVAASSDEVLFTSGATESNNLAILGLAAWGEQNARRHIISTAIEHKAVLEPLEELTRRGFQVDLVRPTAGGWVEPEAVAAKLRPDTLLVSVMHVNNETGVVQPLREIANALADSSAFLHVDAAQGFGKNDLIGLPRIDLLSISGHKIYGPKGVGALVTRRRKFVRPPLTPLVFGGGQEKGLRPGTLPVPLIVGLGLAAELAVKEHSARTARCRAFRMAVLETFRNLKAAVNGAEEKSLPHVVNVSIPGLDSEAAIVAVKDLVAISNGSACTSQSYEPSHVLIAMGLAEARVRGALRLSWCHLTEEVAWNEVRNRLARLM